MYESETDPSDHSLYRDEEEDLVDYDDSELETDTVDHSKSPIPAEPEEPQPDIFAEDTSELEETTQKNTTENIEPKQESDKSSTSPATTASSAVKTPQAATLLKSLAEMLSNPDFRSSLGLTESGNAIDLSFWASGLDFALTLALVGTAKVKVCKYGVECHNPNCTFDHGGADKTAKIAAGKPVKLCSMINTANGCQKGDACWFSHEALGQACTHGELRTTCTKGLYCFYRHSDDAVIVVEAVDPSVVEADGGHAANNQPSTTQPLPETKTGQTTEAQENPLEPQRELHATSATYSQENDTPERQGVGHKHGRSDRGGTGDRSHKHRRVRSRHDQRDRHDSRDRHDRRDYHDIRDDHSRDRSRHRSMDQSRDHSRDQSEGYRSSYRGKGSRRHRGPGHGRGSSVGRDGQGDSYRSPGRREHYDRERESLSHRITRD